MSWCDCCEPSKYLKNRSVKHDHLHRSKESKAKMPPKTRNNSKSKSIILEIQSSSNKKGLLFLIYLITYPPFLTNNLI